MNPRPIIVIEDSAEDFDMIMSGLRVLGIESAVSHLSEPEEVRRWMGQAPIPATVIFMDLNLQGESGIDLIKALKNHPTHALTPIAVLSTSANPRDIRESYSAGANAYHMKPLETPRFYALVQQIATYWCKNALTISSHTYDIA